MRCDANGVTGVEGQGGGDGSDTRDARTRRSGAAEAEADSTRAATTTTTTASAAAAAGAITSDQSEIVASGKRGLMEASATGMDPEAGRRFCAKSLSFLADYVEESGGSRGLITRKSRSGVPRWRAELYLAASGVPTTRFVFVPEDRAYYSRPAVARSLGLTPAATRRLPPDMWLGASANRAINSSSPGSGGGGGGGDLSRTSSSASASSRASSSASGSSGANSSSRTPPAFFPDTAAQRSGTRGGDGGGDGGGGGGGNGDGYDGELSEERRKSKDLQGQLRTAKRRIDDLEEEAKVRPSRIPCGCMKSAQ